MKTDIPKKESHDTCPVCGSIDIGTMFTADAAICKCNVCDARWIYQISAESAVNELVKALEELMEQPGMDEFFAKERLRELLNGEA